MTPPRGSPKPSTPFARTNPNRKTGTGRHSKRASWSTARARPFRSFPLRIEGEVVETGCDNTWTPVNQYETLTRAPMSSNFRKGSTFRVEWSLEKDKAGDPERDFWIATAQHYDQPWRSGATTIYYWG